jgi:GT2 family glycosyltransferase
MERGIPAYTAVGGTKRAASTGISAVLLNRGGRYPRRTLFQELEKAGFDYIVSIEGPHERYDLEDLSGRFPFVRFILLKETISSGEAVNLAASELSTPLFFVLWNDQKLFNGGGAARIAQLFMEETQNGFRAKQLCTVPVIQNSRFESFRTLVTPFYDNKKVCTLPEIPEHENQMSLYPYDWVGIYDRDRFLRTGGFDREIAAPYWQLMDFGLRAHLWGEEIRATQNVHIVYDGEMAPEDSSEDASYRLFYLKNIAPVLRGDYAHLPLRRFPGYLVLAGWDLFTALVEFNRGRRWVAENRNRFRIDPGAVLGLWEHLEEE